VVWIEQPVGTGFSQGIPTATDETEVAAQFMGFWENFMDTFDLQGRKVFITGESCKSTRVQLLRLGELQTKHLEHSFMCIACQH